MDPRLLDEKKLAGAFDALTLPLRPTHGGCHDR